MSWTPPATASVGTLETAALWNTNVRDNLLWGSLFTFVTLIVFLRSARSTVIIFAHILISTIGAFMVMALLGRSLNVPALGGLA